ncbi:MAG: PLDc N-terminal domain-containing protein [Aureibaculum sp.]|nr:PLDc N-terminal domain-containing protein [Aureibaculum sp.]
MKKSTKIWLGILTFLPMFLIFAYIFHIFTAFIPTAIRLENSHQEVPIELFQSISVMILFIALAIIIRMGIMIYYIVHASNNPKNENNTKVMWIVLLVLVGTISSIVYYFLEILPSKDNSNQSIGYNS